MQALTVASSFIDAGHHATKLLGSPAAVGMALVEALHAGAPWLSPQEAAARAKVSDDTARRRLDELASIDRAEIYDIGSGRKLYRIAPEVAESIMSRLAAAAPTAEPASDCG